MPKLTLSCTLMEAAAPFAETNLNRDRNSGKRPRRIRVATWNRRVRKPGPCQVINCQNLDIVL